MKRMIVIPLVIACLLSCHMTAFASISVKNLEDILVAVTDVVVAEYQGRLLVDTGESGRYHVIGYDKFEIESSVRGTIEPEQYYYDYVGSKPLPDHSTSLDFLWYRKEYEVGRTYLLFLIKLKDPNTGEEAVQNSSLVIPLDEEGNPEVEKVLYSASPISAMYTNDEDILASVDNGTLVEVLLTKIEDNSLFFEASSDTFGRLLSCVPIKQQNSVWLYLLCGVVIAVIVTFVPLLVSKRKKTAA